MLRPTCFGTLSNCAALRLLCGWVVLELSKVYQPSSARQARCLSEASKPRHRFLHSATFTRIASALIYFEQTKTFALSFPSRQSVRGRSCSAGCEIEQAATITWGVTRAATPDLRSPPRPSRVDPPRGARGHMSQVLSWQWRRSALSLASDVRDDE